MDENASQESVETSSSPQLRTVFLCRMCRTVLFDETHQNEHGRDDPSVEHTSIFLREMVPSHVRRFGAGAWWMPKVRVNDGKLMCPGKNCDVRLGTWSWAGTKCSCGVWVAPSFQIVRSKVDERKELVDNDAQG